MELLKPKILIVDDLPENLKALGKLLQRVDAEVMRADSGNKALQLSLKHHFALALVDIQMPDMDGYETVDLMLEQGCNKDCPIIFVTAAYQDELHRIKGYMTGAVDYIEKPVDDVILLSKVSIFLKLYNQQVALKQQYERLNKEVALRATMDNHLKNLSVAIEQSPVAVLITDKKGTIEFVNHSFEEISGYTNEECLGKNSSLLQSGQTPQGTYDSLWETINKGETWQGEFHNKKKNGDFFWEHAIISAVKDENNEIEHFIGVKEDITQRKHYQYELLQQQNYDDVTSLPNRILALDRMSQAAAYTERTKQNTSILFIDVDNFKNINKTLGHAIGNKVLVEIATRLTDCIRRDDTLARMGGDEFLIILPGLDKAEMIEGFCQKVLSQFQQPLIIEQQEIYTSLSIGITQTPADGTDSMQLLQNAESAMYQAKTEGRNTFRFFTHSMNEEANHHMNMERRLRHALENNALEVYYQPLLNCKTQQLIGAEALLRWHDKELGVVSPEDFIPLAELCGLIDEIGRWVLSTATAQAQQWLKYNPDFRIAVNFSAQQFFRQEISQEIASVLNKNNLPCINLEAEITERLLMHEGSDALLHLLEIADLGVSLSIDDFGTGYSSLSYLKRFPISTVKIDKSFINDITTDPEDAILTKTIINMAHSLSMNVIAEGVETLEQLEFLQQHKCDMVQGYYFSKPVPAKEFEVFFSRFK